MPVRWAGVKVNVGMWSGNVKKEKGGKRWENTRFGHSKVLWGHWGICRKFGMNELAGLTLYFPEQEDVEMGHYANQLQIFFFYILPFLIVFLSYILQFLFQFHL